MSTVDDVDFPTAVKYSNDPAAAVPALQNAKETYMVEPSEKLVVPVVPDVEVERNTAAGHPDGVQNVKSGTPAPAWETFTVNVISLTILVSVALRAEDDVFAEVVTLKCRYPPETPIVALHHDAELSAFIPEK